MNRKPFTITMRRDLLKKVDSLIDETKIRNRSHALEYIASSYFKPKVKSALVLAGGDGVKMRPFTYELPKTMLPVGGRPILEHIIALLKKSDIRDIKVAIGHLGDRVRDHFGDGAKFGVEITYIDEPKKLGTGGSLRNALPLMGAEPFVLFWGDVLVDIDLQDMIEFHLDEGALMTVALTSVSDPSEYGAVKLHGNRLVEYIEKPRPSRAMSHLVSSGVHIADPKIADFLQRKGPSMLEKDAIPRLVGAKEIIGYLFEGQWFDVGTPEIYQRAIKEWGVKLREAGQRR